MIIDPKGKLNKIMLKKALIILVALCAVIGVGAIAIKFVYDKIIIKENADDLANIPVYDRNETEEEANLNQNIAIFGVDKDGMRTDVIFVVNLNTTTDAIKVIAVPRDTKVAWTTYQQDKMEELGKGYHEYSKITEMSAYGGLDNLRYFTVNTLEDIMGIKIDHYAVVNIDAFRKIVDAVGGVEVNVPRRMQYNDSYQDLHIDLQPGLQVLNGEQAEGLVRWRHNEDYSEQYAEGDVGRIETQQLFLKALAHKVISSSSTTDLLKIISAVYGDLKTDITISDAKKYLKCLSQFKAENITFATLPGEAVREDKWYYILDQEEVDAFMQKLMYDRDVPIVREETSTDGKRATSVTSADTSYNTESSYSNNEDYDTYYEQEDTDDRNIELPENNNYYEEDDDTYDEEEWTPPSEPTQSESSQTPSNQVPAQTEVSQPQEPANVSAPTVDTPSSSDTDSGSTIDPTLQTTDGIEEPIS